MLISMGLEESRKAHHITSDKANFSLFQSRHCFEKIVEIEPGKERMVKGKENKVFQGLG